jgi:hypothetical protein
MEVETQFTNIRAISDAELKNVVASLQKHVAEHGLIDKLIKLYVAVPDSFTDTYPRERIPILQMFWTCYRGFLVSTQLVLEAHIPESYAITSKSAEAVAIAQKFNLHPEKIEPWVRANKEDDQPFRRLLGPLFPKEDGLLQPEIFGIYLLTTEHGRHPNFSSTAIYSDFDKIRSENTVVFGFNDMLDDGTNYRRNLNYNIFAYFKFLIAFSEIFGKYLNKNWVKELSDFNTIFNSHRDTLKKEFGYGMN